MGQHTIILETKDRDGKIITLKRNFTIVSLQGNEGRVLGTASGEPTIMFTATPTPTESIYNSPIPTIPYNITTTPPVSGNNFSWTIFSSLSLIIIGGGILLAF